MIPTGHLQAVEKKYFLPCRKKFVLLQPEMDADHVEAWSQGGATTEENCQLLCLTHNRAKGNR